MVNAKFVTVNIMIINIEQVHYVTIMGIIHKHSIHKYSIFYIVEMENMVDNIINHQSHTNMLKKLS